MTEKEKMLRGMLYDADDSALCADRVRAKELCHAYNQLRPSDAAGMRELLRQLLGKTGETFCVTVRLRLQHPARGVLLRQPQSRHSRLRRGDVRRARVRGAKLRVLHGRPPDRRRVPRAGAGVCLPNHRGRSCVDRRRCAGHARRHDREQCRDRGRQRRRQRHSERFGRCRQSVQGHSADHGGGQTDLLGQIARGCMARGTQDANQNAEARQNAKRKAV